MTAEMDIRAGVIALLRGDATLMAQVNRVYDGAPAKATPPTLIVGECVGSDWGTKDKAGRELRLTLAIEDEIETSARIGGIMSLADTAVHQLAGMVGGWRVASLRPARSRLVRTNAGRWNAVLDYRVRVLAA